jgi:O-antigen ligase
MNQFVQKPHRQDHANFLVLAPLLVLYVEYVRPGDMVGALSYLRLGILAITFSALVWLTKCDKRHLKDPVIVLYMVFVAQMVIMTPIAVNNYWAFHFTLLLITYLFGFVLPAMALVNSIDRAVRIFRHWVIIYIYLTVVVIYQGGTGPGGFLGDENDAALAINMGLPYVCYMAAQRGISTVRRWIYYAAIALGVFAIAVTFSRGGFVGLVAVGLVMWWFSRYKIRALLAFSLAVIVSGSMLLTVLPAGYLERIETMFDPSDGTRSERLYSWGLGWDMYLANPVVGVGPGNYPWRVREFEPPLELRPPGQPPVDGRAAHSLYATLLPEMGTVGTVVMFSMGWIATRRLLRVSKAVSNVKGDSEVPDDAHFLGLMAKAALASLFAFLVTGAFISVLYYPPFWVWLAFSSIIYYLSQRATFSGVNSVNRKSEVSGRVPVHPSSPYGSRS